MARERAAETKSEYIDGAVVAMSGASRNHVRLCVNLTRELSQQLRHGPCEVFAQDMRTRVAEANLYAYPDLAVVCGEPLFEDDQFDVLLNPTVIIEVLSPSTEGYDRGLKARLYRQRASLREHVLVSQDRPVVECYTREGDSWTWRAAVGLDAVLELPTIGCRLVLRDLYERVEGLRDPNADAPAP